MTHPIDPHHPIALLSRTIGQQPERVTRRFHIQRENLIGGVGDSHAVNMRTLPILDAFASLCISERQHQVVAVALQLNEGWKEIRLVISENGKPKRGPDLVKYVGTVWDLLRRISDAFACENSSPQKDSENINWSMESDPVPASIAQDLQVELFREIYLHTVQKHRARMEKWSRKLESFMNRLFRFRDKELSESERELDIACGMLECGYEILDTEELRRLPFSDWRHADALLAEACEVFGQWTEPMNKECEQLVREIDQEPIAPFKLRRALEKLSTQYRHLQTLIQFANSNRLRKVLAYRMSIKVVPTTTDRLVYLPATSEHWESVIRQANGESRYRDSYWPVAEAKRIAASFERKTRWYPDLHCECAVVAYLVGKSNNSPVSDMGRCDSNIVQHASGVTQALGHQRHRAAVQDRESESYAAYRRDRKEQYRLSHGRQDHREDNIAPPFSNGPDWDNTPAFSYIGVSKLSCRSCQLWIKCHNRFSGPQFFTRGGHGKWYWPWGLPSCSSPELMNDLVSKLCWQYEQHCRTKDILARSSDSTDPDVDPRRTIKSGPRRRLAEEYLRAHRPYYYRHC